MAARRDQGTGNLIVDLERSSIDAEVRTTTVRIVAPLPSAAAPATLIDLATRTPVLDVHRIARATDDEVAFETYGVTEEPPVGSYVLQPWWTPDALALLLDSSRTWTLAAYPSGAAEDLPDDGPDYCRLTYESFEPGVAAYTDSKGSWISVEAFEQFIAGDLLRVRAGDCTLE